MRACYENSLALAEQHNLNTIAVPAISTGVYAYPKREAAETALSVMRQRVERFETIIACCFSQADAALYHQLCPECLLDES